MLVFSVKLFYIFLMIKESYQNEVKDKLPVLEYLGCDECPRIYVPVCGTDGKTYMSACRLNCLNSRLQKDEWIFIKRYGPCIDYGIEFP